MSLKTKKIKIKDIKPASYNPRQIDDTNKENLQKSIEEFGLVDPIIINLNNNNIIGGHQRFDYLCSLDEETELHLLELGDVGWVFSDTDLKIKDAEHEKALNLALNRISGEWNINALNNILDELKEFQLDDLTGFDYSLDDFDYEFVPLDSDDYEDDDFSDEFIDDIEDDILIDDVIEDDVPRRTAPQKTNENKKKIIHKDSTGNIIFVCKYDDGKLESNKVYVTSSENLINVINQKAKRIG